MITPETEFPNGVEMLLIWLSTLGEGGPGRPSGDALPYRMVRRIGGHDDGVTDFGDYSVHTLATGASREAAFLAADDASTLTHNRMLALGPPLVPPQPVTLNDGRIVRADEVLTLESPVDTPYGDQLIVDFVGRYRVALRRIAVL